MTEEEHYEKIKAEYEASTDEKLVEWARPYFEGTKKPDGTNQYEICTVTDIAANRIEELTGSKVKGFKHVITDEIVRHIAKRHGKHGEADKSMQDINHLGRMAYVFANCKAENITLLPKRSRKFRDKTSQFAKTVEFALRINGTVCVWEAVTDSARKMILCTSTEFIKAKSKGKMTKKESEDLDVCKSTPESNVLNGTRSITSILPQSEKNVNSLE